MQTQPLLLVVDDEVAILKTLKESLEDENFRVETLSDGNKALGVIGQLVPDVILLDIFMPKCNGLELLEKIKQEYPQQKVIIISGFGTIPIAIDAVQKGAIDFIEKPLNLNDVLAKLEFLKKTNSTAKNKSNTTSKLFAYEKFGIIGRSYLFQEFMQALNKLAPLSMPVTIYGNHGTGKSLFASYLHRTGNDAHGAFLTIDCNINLNELPLKQINSAFATQRGTLFIKNIHTLSIKTQSQLLNLLQQPANFRLIASSKTSLFKLMQMNQFEETLFYKLNVAPIEIAPLIRRKYDIPLLTDYFLAQANKMYEKSVTISATGLRALRNFNWAGNTEQLKNTLDLIVQANEPTKNISASDLCMYLQETDTLFVEEQMFTRFSSLTQATQSFEKNFLTYSLKKNFYDISQTSAMLNLDISSLRDKLSELNILAKT